MEIISQARCLTGKMSHRQDVSQARCLCHDECRWINE